MTDVVKDGAAHSAPGPKPKLNLYPNMTPAQRAMPATYDALIASVNRVTDLMIDVVVGSAADCLGEVDCLAAQVDALNLRLERAERDCAALRAVNEGLRREISLLGRLDRDRTTHKPAKPRKPKAKDAQSLPDFVVREGRRATPTEQPAPSP